MLEVADVTNEPGTAWQVEGGVLKIRRVEIERQPPTTPVEIAERVRELSVIFGDASEELSTLVGSLFYTAERGA